MTAMTPLARCIRTDHALWRACWQSTASPLQVHEKNRSLSEIGPNAAGKTTVFKLPDRLLQGERPGKICLSR